VKRYLPFLCGVAVFFLTVLNSRNILSPASAQVSGGEVSLATLQSSDTTYGTRVRSVSNNSEVAEFSYLPQSLPPSATNVIDPFQAMIRPITRTLQGATMVNGASLEGIQIARGSFGSVLGTELANSTQSAPQLPFILDGVTVAITQLFPRNNIACRIAFISPTRVNFIVPNGIATGNSLPFSVNNNGVVSTGTINIVDAAPGIFTADGSGTGMPSAYCLSKFPGFPDIYSDLPCAASTSNFVSILILLGTGWRNAPGTQVKINGMTLTPIYSGPEAGGPVRDQINVQLPSNLLGVTDADLSVVALGTNIESRKVKISFQGIPTNLILLEGDAGVDCLTKVPGMPHVYSESPCTVSNG
jgi:uncharacterized protein (TIGR03437 family)